MCQMKISMAVYDPTSRKLCLFSTHNNFDSEKVSQKLNDVECAISDVKPDEIKADTVEKIHLTTVKT